MIEPTAEAKAFHRELYVRSMDTWMVHNPDETDYIVYVDRRGPTAAKWVIPGCNRDVGDGKGNKQVPAYVMRLYREHKGIEMINELIKTDWEKRKFSYREEERSRMEETLALKSSDPALWEQVVPLLVKGIVSRFGGDDIIEEVEQEPQVNTRLRPGEAAMEKLQMTDRDYNLDDIESKKTQFTESIS